jgi:thiamine-phosphate pyrophosphorylase
MKQRFSIMPALANCRPHGLYLLTAQRYPDADRLLTECHSALEGGASMLQFRDKSADSGWRKDLAGRLNVLCSRYSVPLIINDDIELAVATGAAGVHLGRTDTGISEAAVRLPAGAIIGASCYNRMELAREAVAQGASYLAFGSMFPSASKPEAVACEPGLLQAARAFGLPLVAIGGINAENGASLVDAGADYLAVISAVFGQDNARQAAEQFRDLWNARTPSSSAEQDQP